MLHYIVTFAANKARFRHLATIYVNNYVQNWIPPVSRCIFFPCHPDTFVVHCSSVTEDPTRF